MRETNFIKQKKDKWIELERTMQQSNPDPEKLNDLYVQITDDLSYSRTFYPNRSVRVYLNGLAQQIFYSIYRNKKTTGNKFLEFWVTDLPRIMYQCRWELFLGILLFWIPFIGGCLSGTMGEEEEFARQLLGNDYINMTLANIQSGDPMAVYKDQSALTMFIGIFLNNLMVSFRYFMFGALFTIGSVVSLIYFGLYVGAFQYFFFEQGELLPSVLGIWTHGSLEIPAAILAGVGGIVMGKGLVFPGTYSRIQAFMISARKGIQIMIGTIPLILAAAFIESYITRLTDTPDILRASFITFNLFFVLFYYVVWPYIQNTENFTNKIPLIGGITGMLLMLLIGLLFFFNVPNMIIVSMISIPPLLFIAVKSLSILGHYEGVKIEEVEEKLQAEKNTSLRFDRIKTSGEIFKDSFVVYRKKVGHIFMIAFGAASIFTAGVLLLGNGKPTDLFAYPASYEGVFEDLFYFITGGVIEESKYIGQFFNYKGNPLSIHFIANSIVYTLVAYFGLKWVKNTYHELTTDLPSIDRWQNKWIDFSKVAIIVLIGNMMLLAGEVLGVFKFLFVISIPLLLLWAAISVLEETNIMNALARAFKLLFTRLGNTFQLFLIFGLISIMILALIFSPVMMFILENFGYNLSASQDTMDQVLVILVTFIAQFMFALISFLLVIGSGLLYYSQIEITDAKSLFEKIQKIGTGKRIRGLEREG